MSIIYAIIYPPDCFFAHDVQLQIADTNEPKSQECTTTHTVLKSLKSALWALLALLVEHSLVHWYQQCVTVHHVHACMSCHKAIIVTTGRAHYFLVFIIANISCSSCFWVIWVLRVSWSTTWNMAFPIYQ